MTSATGTLARSPSTLSRCYSSARWVVGASGAWTIYRKKERKKERMKEGPLDSSSRPAAQRIAATMALGLCRRGGAQDRRRVGPGLRRRSEERRCREGLEKAPPPAECCEEGDARAVPPARTLESVRAWTSLVPLVSLVFVLEAKQLRREGFLVACTARAKSCTRTHTPTHARATRHPASHYRFLSEVTG